MEGHAAEAPLKVCRHCSVASRTEADDCPSCGKPYARRWPWRWIVAILVIVVAFGAGYGGRKLIEDDSEGEVASITLEEGREVELGVSRAELEESLGEPPVVKRTRVGPAGECLYYGVSDQPRTVWEFCFRKEQLVVSREVGARSAPAPK
jgi:hypothetical protein